MTHHTMNCRRTQFKHAKGFSLFEVLIALVIASVGLLGVAKLQALTYASTGTASLRSLMTIEGASLSALMRANRGFWASPINNSTNSIIIDGTTITANGALSSAAMSDGYCDQGANAPCIPSDMAASDLQTWADAVIAMFPNLQPQTTISCPANVPVVCTVTMQWTEKVVSIDKTHGSVATVNMQAPQYVFTVEP
ncbi:MAG TPA: prepilin-type N-terminal cleavage/methylation domain-containing protein [Steroidobacteraceae bacterium]|nr:prepilin-type N-terminal cleavage/methylation domain-containing protein [Steroidobacteraceae bacterium]